MAPRNVFLLLALSAIWGSAFMFYAYLTPIFGVFLTAGLRLFVAGLVLWILYLVTRFSLSWKENWKLYLVIGILNSAIPFVLYSFASLSIPSSIEVVLNALTPVFGAIFSAIFLRDRLGFRKAAGIVIGFVGVAVLAGLGPFPLNVSTIVGCAACLAACASYAIAAVYLKKKAGHLSPRANAAGSQLLGGIVLLPFAPISPPHGAIGLEAIGIMLLFAVLCSAIAYLIYYRLVEVAGPTTALSVTFPMPVFGFFWGALILGERITVSMVLGAVIILLGMYLITRSAPKLPKPA